MPIWLAAGTAHRDAGSQARGNRAAHGGRSAGWVMVAPIIPGLTDLETPAILEAAKEPLVPRRPAMCCCGCRWPCGRSSKIGCGASAVGPQGYRPDTINSRWSDVPVSVRQSHAGQRGLCRADCASLSKCLPRNTGIHGRLPCARQQPIPPAAANERADAVVLIGQITALQNR